MMHANETFVNATKGYQWGDSGWQETYCETRGELFRAAQSEHGRCISTMYRDGADGEAIPVGWVFAKRKQYEDCEETYLAETWVEVRENVRPHCHTCHAVHGTGEYV